MRSKSLYIPVMRHNRSRSLDDAVSVDDDKVVRSGVEADSSILTVDVSI